MKCFELLAINFSHTFVIFFSLSFFFIGDMCFPNCGSYLMTFCSIRIHQRPLRWIVRQDPAEKSKLGIRMPFKSNNHLAHNFNFNFIFQFFFSPQLIWIDSVVVMMGKMSMKVMNSLFELSALRFSSISFCLKTLCSTEKEKFTYHFLSLTFVTNYCCIVYNLYHIPIIPLTWCR